LFAGFQNPKVFFQKAVKRAISLGFSIEIVRADSAYCTLKNLLFLQKLSLGYALSMPSTFTIVKKGKKLFKKLARKKSHLIFSVSMGVSILDMGKQSLDGLETRILIVRRIQRRKSKKDGKWKIKTYFYAINTNLDWSPRKIYQFYHDRQRIESGFKELKGHYYLENLPTKNIIGNEFWIACKMFAATMVKIFQRESLPKALQSLMRGTLLRMIFKRFFCFMNGKVELLSKGKKDWLSRRLFSKFKKMELILSTL
jgi:hypothetical protein